MSENKSGSDPHTTQEINPQPNTQLDASRRRLMGAGFGVSAIFTLASQPVLAATCVTASAAASGNLSHHGTTPVCQGRTPSFWKQSGNSWPTGYDQGKCSGPNCSASPENWTGGTQFSNIFGEPPRGSTLKVKGASLSLNQIMVMNGKPYQGATDPDGLSAYIVAALLNAASERTKDVLSVKTVIGIWNEWVTKGYFEPTAGVKWDSKQIVTYLKTTMS